MSNSRSPLIIIHVEGEKDVYILKKILQAARVIDNVIIKSHSGKKNVSLEIQKLGLKQDLNEIHIALIDSDIYSVPDSHKEARHQLNNPDIKVFCAIPEIEAWIFADDTILNNYRTNPHAQNILARMPLPESIPYPKQAANNIFGIGREKIRNNGGFSFLDDFDINRAISRSPSLRVFINEIYAILGRDLINYENFLGASIGRNVFSTLLQELPSHKVVWKTLEGNMIDAYTLSREISEGTDLGMQYVSEVLRIARDMIARKANK